MSFSWKTGLALGAAALLLGGAGGHGGCSDADSAAAREQQQTNDAQTQIMRAQPVPVFDYSLERKMLSEIYTARQKATATYSYVQSELTGKVLWSCQSIGYPIPYATQLTNPQQVRVPFEHTAVAVAQPEPNGLYSPAASDATWVPCVGPNGRITPVYEEKHVTVFLQPMNEANGTLSPAAGGTPSFSISVH